MDPLTDEERLIRAPQELSPAPSAAPVNFFKSGRARVVLCILFCELCERLTYYSIIGNLVIFCTNELGYSSATAAVIVAAFSGTSYFVPIFGGWVADSIAGKYNTIFGSLLIYFVGAVTLPLISIYYEDIGDGNVGLTNSQKQGFFVFGLLLVSMGTGGIKSNVGPFGAQQMEDLGEGAVQTFFYWFYWFINVGSGIAYSAVVYVQQEVGFGVGFTIPAVSILLAIIILVLSRNKYLMKPPEGSVLTKVVKITFDGTKQCTCMHANQDEDLDSCLDRTKISKGGRYQDQEVDDVKSLGRVIPVFIPIIIYWTIYIQMSSTYLLQGERMRLKYGDFTIPVAALNLFNVVIILILIPIMDRIVYPCFERNGMRLSMLKRIGIGMCFAAGSMIVAAIVEICRKNVMRGGGFLEQTIADVTYNASDVSVFAQIPQYCLIGTSEVFTSITGLEFAYSQSPDSMQGVIMGLFLMTTGLGSYLGSLLVIIVNAASSGTWIPDEINDGFLEYFYFLLAGLMLLDFLVFLIIAHRYKYVNGSTRTGSVDSFSSKPNEEVGYSYNTDTESLLPQSPEHQSKRVENDYSFS
ncbi:solute carrier family 15 member 4-like [Lytechinus pictus]|uniref:solute carrier family 15 member 4-like n=1 Tax=Lytechinus pictus TaxID=7653 RepID=UPI0030B9FAF6